MSKFMHKLAEALRTREQYLEEHSAHPIFETETGKELQDEYDALQKDIRALKARVEKAQATGKDYDEHLEREVKNDHEQLFVKIDAWSKKIS